MLPSRSERTCIRQNRLSRITSRTAYCFAGSVAMASRLFALLALLLIVASVAGYLVAAGWIPWMYPVAVCLIGLIAWGFVALRSTRRSKPALTRGGRPGLELWDPAGRTINENPGKR